MSEEGQQLRVPQNCCRLCLAPDSECISILNSYAADKEPLATKIQNCVSIKILPNDRLSLRVCHACISYLNSWQSFKNRCVVSQHKQRQWLDGGNNVSISAAVSSAFEQQQQDDYDQDQTDMATSISSLKKRKSLTVYPLPAVQIKDEPEDPDEDYGMRHHDETDDLVDPTMFLEQAPLDTTIFNYDNHDRPDVELTAVASTKTAATEVVKEASCRACNLTFSTRANARRHERNLHPNLFELSTSSTHNTTITKPTPALAAALQLQRAATAAAAAEASRAQISPQKYRQEVVNAFNKCEGGGYDYEHPEKYVHLLTDEKIVFLHQNEEFLSQYQNMTCRCCNRYYATYKNFMAHMRKKYSALPRNLCFNCLKLNDSKALFISHLKRRNCINLHKVLHTLMEKDENFAADVRATVAAAPDKLRAKELLVNKMYECKLCPRRFRLKLEFRSHVYEDHADAQKKDPALTQCSFCDVNIEDPQERKRHYNNMDCIVSLRCVTCDSKFENHQKFLDHVYEKHLSGFDVTQQSFSGEMSMFGGKSSVAGSNGASSADESRSTSLQKSQYFSRMPQACPICGQQYNNYNNVLRHMESKHPNQLPQTYKCVKCGTGYPRLSNLREHMVSAHSADKVRHTGFEYIVNAEAIKNATDSSNGNNVYAGRYDYVMKDLMSITNGGTTADDDDEPEHVAKKMRTDHPPGCHCCAKTCSVCKAVFTNNIGLSNHMRSHTAADQRSGSVAGRQSSSSLTITALSSTSKAGAAPSQTVTHPTHQQAVFKRTLEQNADRRFRRMRCRMCQRRFSSKKSYRFHMLNDHQIQNVQFIRCKLCDAEFAYEKGLKVHMFKIHNTLLKDEMIIKQYECDICSIVYRTEPQLLQHKKSVHEGETAKAEDDVAGGDASSLGGADLSGISTPVSVSGGGERNTLEGTGAARGPLYWYQCKYCPSNFNTNKKLAIHINSHDEFDSHDYSCKDCGNVYSGRKSLWVHRYKKHPQIAEPSECVLCKKVFFDSRMLENHIPTCNRKPITALTGATSEATVFKHKTGDDDEGVAAHEVGAAAADVSALKLPGVACTMCGKRFTDQELFQKHFEMHEKELYTDNPLAAMFDTGPVDPNQFFLDRVNDMGEYSCDLCSKTFTQMTAFKVHRKWHFRGDSKQIPTHDTMKPADTLAKQDNSTLASYSSQTQINHPRHLALQAVGLIRRPQDANCLKRKRELKCEYCPSTFISNNNLRRHIHELHNDIINNLAPAPKIKCDTEQICRRCDLHFDTKQEWILHKIADARIMKPFGPFQWGCDLCGAYVSRKEKLINHIQNHLKDEVILPVEQQKEEQQAEGAESNPKVENGKMDEDDEEEEEYEGDEDEDEGEEDAEGENENDVEVDGEYDGEVEEDYDVENVSEVVVTNVNANDAQQAATAADEDEDIDDEDDVEEMDEDDDESTSERKTTSSDKRQRETSTTEAEDTQSDDEAEEDDEDDDDDDDNDGDDDEEDGDGDDEEEIDASAANKNDNDDDLIEEDDDVDADDLIEEDTSMSSAEELKPPPPAVKVRFSCDLCQLYFDTQQDLQKHVKMHFLNGPGSVTLPDFKTKSANKSRSSSSDVVTVSSS